jgi:hypothetical protein
VNLNISTTEATGRVPAVISLIAFLLTAASGAVAAELNASDAESGIIGTWAVQVTQRSCDTTAPLSPPFASVETFQRGGTSIGSTSSLSFAAGQRTSEHGIWSQWGRRTFRQRFLALILFDTAPNLPDTPSFDPNAAVSPGFSTGWQTVTHTLTLSDADHYTSVGTTAFYTADGTLYRTGCSTAIGQRFE